MDGCVNITVPVTPAQLVSILLVNDMSKCHFLQIDGHVKRRFFLISSKKNSGLFSNF